MLDQAPVFSSASDSSVRAQLNARFSQGRVAFEASREELVYHVHTGENNR